MTASSDGRERLSVQSLAHRFHELGEGLQRHVSIPAEWANCAFGIDLETFHPYAHD